MPRKTAPDIVAAGGVVWRVRDGATEIALVHRPRYDDWTLPKGKLEHREHELAAAVREVAEELGAHVAVSRRLTHLEYRVGHLTKRVSYWVMRYIGGDFAANDEVDDVAWLALAAARSRLTYADERAVLDEFGSAPLPESVIALVRHAKAGKRSEWHDDDRLRPLECAGRTQARRLAVFLEHFAPDRVVSARPVRCSQSVTPLAESRGLTIETDAAFDDTSFGATPEISEAALIALAVARHVTVVASQGDAIPGLVARLAPQVGSGATRKGAVWVLSFADGVLLAADYYPDAAR